MATSPSAPDSLRVRKGQRVEAAHHNGLVRLASQLTIQRGRLKGRQDPDGFTPHVEVSTSVSVDHPFRMSVTEGEDDVQLVTFTPGTVSGVVPALDELALDDVDDAGEPPVLRVEADAWAPHGRVERALILFRYDLDAAFSVLKVTPLAAPKKPDPSPRTWHKLIGFLIRFEGNVRPFQQCFFAQYFDAAGGKTPGAFRAYPRAAG